MLRLNLSADCYKMGSIPQICICYTAVEQMTIGTSETMLQTNVRKYVFRSYFELLRYI